jgi:hypothetical protein
MKQTPEPIRLTVSLIESGKFIRAGEPTPYLRVEDVPEHLRQYAHDESEFPQNLKGVIAFASTLGRSCKRCRARVSIRCASLLLAADIRPVQPSEILFA